MRLVIIFYINKHFRVFIANVDDGNTKNWIFVNNYSDMPAGELYITAFYFTVTTIVTVGYGDITPVNIIEKILTIFLMITGVIGFSFVTGSLASLIQNEDSNQAKLKESLHILQDIRAEYNIGNKLYSHLVQSI